MKCDRCEREVTAVNPDGLCKVCAANDELVAANCAEIKKVYGEERESRANVGWFSSDGYIESKVYGTPCMVVSSTRNDDGTITHEHNPYNN